MPSQMSAEQLKRAKELGVEHLVEGFEPRMSDRAWLLAALAQLEVTEQHDLDPSGNPNHTDEWKKEKQENPGSIKRWIDDRKAFLQRALEGHPPTIDDLLSPSQFEGHHDVLVYDIARGFRTASTLIEDAQKAGINPDNPNNDELLQQLREFHYRSVSEEEARVREAEKRWEQERALKKK